MTNSGTPIAQRSAEIMWAADVSSRHVGMELLEVDTGSAVMRMTVRDFMLNGQDVCHGGYLFMLADSCFAFACNSYNNQTLAQGASIEFLRPALLGDVLTARATEVKRGRTTGVYDIELGNQDAKKVAVFRGSSFASGKPFFADGTDER